MCGLRITLLHTFRHECRCRFRSTFSTNLWHSWFSPNEYRGKLVSCHIFSGELSAICLQISSNIDAPLCTDLCCERDGSVCRPSVGNNLFVPILEQPFWAGWYESRSGSIGPFTTVFNSWLLPSRDTSSLLEHVFSHRCTLTFPHFRKHILVHCVLTNQSLLVLQSGLRDFDEDKKLIIVLALA